MIIWWYNAKLVPEPQKAGLPAMSAAKIPRPFPDFPDLNLNFP